MYSGAPPFEVVSECAIGVVSLGTGALLGFRLSRVAGAPPRLKDAAWLLLPALLILAVSWFSVGTAGQAFLLYIGGCMLGINRTQRMGFRLLSTAQRVLVIAVGLGVPLGSAAVLSWLAHVGMPKQ